MGAAVTTVTAVVPLFDVEGYVGEFLDSLASQRPGAYALDLVFVDDGSTDGTARIVQEWIDEHALPALLIRQDRGGVSVARNVGLARARGEWVTFPDPDDVLDPHYFASVADYLHGVHAAPDLAVTNLRRVVDPDPRFGDTHALRFRFVQGTRTVSLDDDPDLFQMSVASAFFPRTALLDAGVEFLPGLHASEDALFVARYLLSRERPRMGLVAGALYGYRRRASRDSAVDGYRRDPRSYVDRFENGYLPLLRDAARAGGVPGWLQSMVLYECQWLLPQQRDPRTYAATLDTEMRARTREALASCLAFVTDDRLQAYDATALPLESRVLALALTGRRLWDWVGFYADAAPVAGRRHVLRGYSFQNGGPIGLERKGVPVETHGCKERPLDYFGQRVLREVAVRAAERATSVTVEGVQRPVIWPRPGEAPSQAADRHRRKHIGDRSRALPPPPGAVRVWKSFPSAPAEGLRVFAARRRHDATVLRAAIGGAAIGGAAAGRRQGWLVEHDPDDPEQLSRALFEQLVQHARERPVHLLSVPVRHHGVPRRALRFGSLGHLRASIGARFHIATRQPSPSRAWRVLIHRGELDGVARAALDAADVDLVIVETDEHAHTVAEATRYFADQVVVIARDRIVVEAQSEITAWADRMPG